MRILLLEDNNDKACSIMETLDAVEFLIKDDIDVVSDLKYAKDELKKHKYDVFIADIQVPKRGGEKAVKSAGFDFIYQLTQRPQIYNIPTHIISITEYKELYDEYREQLNSDMFNMIFYDETGDEWKKILIKNLALINNNLQSTHNSTDYKYDLGIICALNDPEFRQIELLSSKWRKVEMPNSKLPFIETVFDFGDKQLKVVAISINKMGMVPTAVLSTQMIEYFRPMYLAMTGISSAIKGENINLGDILVASPSWDSGSGKFKETDDGKVFEIDPKQEPLDDDISHEIAQMAKDSRLLNKIRESWTHQTISTVLNVHVGPIASGAAVIADKDITSEIQKQSRKMVGIEMEAYGLVYAANHATHERPYPLIIKSVCDYADREKNDGFQNYAAYTSAQFLYEYARSFIKSK